MNEPVGSATDAAPLAPSLDLSSVITSGTQTSRSAEVLPEVSIIIPAYDCAAYIGDALDSVFNQTSTRFEVIVVNDGSPDTEHLERELKRFESRIRYIKQENRGVAAARNAALKVARSDLVAFLDADDYYMPAFLEKQIALLKSTNADVVHADALLFGDPQQQGRTFMTLQNATGDVTPERLLSIKSSILTSTVVARKAPILEIGMFDETMRRAQDFDLWFRLAKAGYRFAYQPDILSNKRVIETSLSGSTVSALKRTMTILTAIEARGGLTEAENEALQFNKTRTLRELALEEGKEKLLNKDYRGARVAFRNARRFRSGLKLTLVSLGLIVAPAVLCHLYRRREARWRKPE